MCPLRVILIFLSATIAGFFLLRGLNAEPDLFQDDDAAAVAANDDDDEGSPGSPRDPVASAAKTGFWTMVDMASGRYLWRTLVAPPAKSDSEKAR
uniref:Methyltransferase-related protein n=1 Tax=Aegilops tauschii subsp. strangulata TaxID=200361 RepID=A0A453HNP1_AEGTS